LKSNEFNLILESNCLINKVCMSSLVEPIVVGVFQQEKKDEPEELGGHQMLSATETNISFEQDKPWCI
jgi:hypothetical protein